MSGYFLEEIKNLVIMLLNAGNHFNIDSVKTHFFQNAISGFIQKPISFHSDRTLFHFECKFP